MRKNVRVDSLSHTPECCMFEERECRTIIITPAIAKRVDKCDWPYNQTVDWYLGVREWVWQWLRGISLHQLHCAAHSVSSVVSFQRDIDKIGMLDLLRCWVTPAAPAAAVTVRFDLPWRCLSVYYYHRYDYTLTCLSYARTGWKRVYT